jgi:hypothetical protein
LYNQSAYQSPVSSGPDELLLISGDGLALGDAVVYQMLPEGQSTATPPRVRPNSSDGNSGTAEVVSFENVPFALTAKMPRTLLPDRTYEVRVLTAHDEWSNPLLINDARPLWFTPSQMSETAAFGTQPRYLKIVGRSLRTSADAKTYIRLVGPQKLVLTALSDRNESQTYAKSVVRIDLPGRIAPGVYRVQLSRDGTHWQTIANQQLKITAFKAAPEFSLDAPAYGACRPNDAVDDTPCLVAAIQAAHAAGGGTVVIPPGIWDFSNAKAAGVTVGDGIVVPPGINLRGAGRTKTTFVRAASWNSGSTNATLSLQGQNTVSGIHFTDERRYLAADPPSPLIQLGVVWYRRGPSAPASVDDVSIFDDVFDKPRIAIASGGLPIRRLALVGNEFGAFFAALTLGGDRLNVAHLFQLEDSVIAGNVFKPGSYLDLAQSQGTIATMLGASLRVDFSGNVADGAATDYLYDQNDAHGWRAGFFWHMNNNHEMLLIAQNTATCTGDKDGDGEAIALDNNANTFAFERARDVLAADPDSVTAAGSLLGKQFEREVDVAAYYVGHWVRIVEGPGIGQSRRIESYSVDPSGKSVTFKVYPRWDVAPAAGKSRVTIGRQFWQTYVLDNRIDQRRPLCQKSNRTRRAGGLISVWAQSSDSVVAGNRQFDTDGISVQQTYIAPDPSCTGCGGSTTLQSFLEIVDNLIDGEYAWDSDCSRSGIMISHSASATPNSPPPILSYGVSIAHNVISKADGFGGGAVTVPLTWFSGPPPHRWPLVDNLLISHNSISGIAGAPPHRECEQRPFRRMGINLEASGLVWHSVLYGNRCTAVREPLFDGGVDTVRVCPSSEADSCECAAQPTSDGHD